MIYYIRIAHYISSHYTQPLLPIIPFYSKCLLFMLKFIAVLTFGIIAFSDFISKVDEDTHLSYTYFPAQSENTLLILGSEEYSATSMIFSGIGPYKFAHGIQPNDYTWGDFANLLFIDTKCGYSAKNTIESIHEFLLKNPSIAKGKLFIVAFGTGAEYALELGELIMETPSKNYEFKGLIFGGPSLQSVIDIKSRPVFAFANDIIEQENRNYITMLYKLCLIGMQKGGNKFINKICSFADSEALGKAAYENYINQIIFDFENKIPFVEKSYQQITNRGDYESCDISSQYSQSNAAKLVWMVERGKSVLLFYGSNDLFTSWYGGYELLAKIWASSDSLEEHKLMKVHGKPICAMRVKDGFTFAKFSESGHYVQIDKPEQVRILVKDWVKKQK